MRILLAAGLLLCSITSQAAINDSLNTENNVREKILNDIRQNLETKNRAIDSTISRLDNRVGKLDSLIKQSASPKDRLDKVVERVQVLEEKQKAIEQNEINVYEANYQSAIINLVSMDREIKPLLLFHATRDFFNALTDCSNPMNYEEFRPGYEKFRVYIDRVKDHDAVLKTVSDVISATGSNFSCVPIVGAYSQLLFSGMAQYVNSIGHNKRELKRDAESMFAVTTALSQFTSEKNLIENEWDGITQSLEEMQFYYDSVMNRNLRMMNIDRCVITSSFTRESDANLRYIYLSTLRQKAGDYVLAIKQSDPKNWKENIYYQLMDVQALKIKYGDITYRIRKHTDKYKTLIARYKTNKDIGTHIERLSEKLEQLRTTFDDTFEPIEYVHAATRMYKVL